jgi:NADPH:quinone reductase-like Zn-dependent oxidoreductase
MHHNRSSEQRDSCLHATNGMIGVLNGISRAAKCLVLDYARTHGSYAEYTAIAPSVKTEPMARIPDGVSDEQAAALPIAGITALRSLDLLRVAASQRLIVMGATGGVGGYAVQMARARGVRVIATVRGDVGEARRLGAEEVYDTKAVEVVDALRAAHPDGVDAVLDLVNDSKAIRLDRADQMLEEFRHGGLRGKSVIRL